MPASVTRDLAQEVLAGLPDGLTCSDERARLALLNPRAKELLGLRAGDWLDREMVELYRALAERAVVGSSLADRLQHHATRAHEMPRMEFTLRAPHDQVIEATWFPLKHEGAGKAYGILWRDVTRDKQAEQIKNQLLSTVSHELRTPLASIKGFATTLLRQDVRWDEATQREFLQIIEEESNRLEELIDNLLDMSQVEAGALRIQREPAQLRRLVREAVENAQRRTEGHWFVVDLPAELPRVWGDPRRIRQVLNNLLENAIKYAPNGGQITVTCEADADAVTVNIADQGQGIPPEFLERIFDRFFQVDGASTRKTGGSGLGLAIAKAIVEAHGGMIWAESHDGHGSIFHFTLPIVKDSDLLQNDTGG